MQPKKLGWFTALAEEKRIWSPGGAGRGTKLSDQKEKKSNSMPYRRNSRGRP